MVGLSRALTFCRLCIAAVPWMTASAVCGVAFARDLEPPSAPALGPTAPAEVPAKGPPPPPADDAYDPWELVSV